jgi:hypothetical protein
MGYISDKYRKNFALKMATAQSGYYSVSWASTNAYPTVRLCAEVDCIVEAVEFNASIDAPLIITTTDSHGFFTNSPEWVAGALGYNMTFKRGDSWPANVRVIAQTTPTAVATGRAIKRWRSIPANRSTGWVPQNGILVTAGSSLDVVLVTPTAGTVLDVNFEFRNNA